MSQVPATQADEQYSSTGLDDMGVADTVLPRINIVQQRGVWKENLTNSEFEELRFIPLGLVKQRVLFHANVEDGDVPMCKSSDFKIGYPNPDAPRQKSFPWDKSGFNPADYPPAPDGTVALPCNGCQLKEWGSHPMGETPYCAEQWTLPVYFDASQDGSGEWQPAILTLQKSQLKPIRTYLTAFKNGNRAPFLNVCKATLRVIERGQVTYSVPTFSRGEESPRERWEEFSQQFIEMRTVLQRPPIREDASATGAAAPTDNTNTAPQQQEAPLTQQQTAPPTQQAPAPAADPQTAQPATAAPEQAQPAPPTAEAPPTQEPPQNGQPLPF